MARPIRFRRSPERWREARIRNDLLGPLDRNLGATMGAPWYAVASDWNSCRFDMDNGDVALFAWREDRPEAYWIGNTETPSALWRTDKFGWEDVPYPIARWAQRELLAHLLEEAPWLEPYPHIAWFFLPVLMSKDGRHTSREFLREHAAGFPDADYRDALSFYETLLHTGVLDEHRDVMAGKLGTSEYLDLTRMSASMSEFTVARLLHEAGYEITPEIEVTTGHSIDYRAERGGTGTLVEVTRPLPPTRRAASSPVQAVRETAETKYTGQLSEHGGGVTLLVDCSSFVDDQWASVKGEQPDVRHRPAVVFRARPDGSFEGYSKGSVSLDLDAAMAWV